MHLRALPSHRWSLPSHPRLQWHGGGASASVLDGGVGEQGCLCPLGSSNCINLAMHLQARAGKDGRSTPLPPFLTAVGTRSAQGRHISGTQSGTSITGAVRARRGAVPDFGDTYG